MHPDDIKAQLDEIDNILANDNILSEIANGNTVDWDPAPAHAKPPKPPAKPHVDDGDSAAQPIEDID